MSDSPTLLADLHAKKERLHRAMEDAWADADHALDVAQKAEDAYAEAHEKWQEECERLVG